MCVARNNNPSKGLFYDEDFIKRNNYFISKVADVELPKIYSNNEVMTIKRGNNFEVMKIPTSV